ncbi:helix-turn-helix domain-containing protein [Paracoccus sp. DMF]|uniref:helix-turn-helix domain-containing protein n=1 Tax=Paracoccus sp. DMF TaxID=400837 RepID=UPI0021E36A18|nr:helix-turn-helix transcriptional regulator [Paracoccus sp. DMF]MCV2447175.1 helix-turn-helix domain-containing protein [Paracoccus sp. DMF]
MTPEQVRMARAALRIGVRDLAEAAGVTPATITRFETEKGRLQHASAEAIRKALEAQGVQFLEGGQVAAGPGVALISEGTRAFLSHKDIQM